MQLTYDILDQHLYAIGATNSGKSRGFEGWALQLIKAGQGVGLLDPHGELYNNVLARIARLDRRIWERVILVDPLHPTRSVGFNPLQLKPGEVAERRAQFLAGLVTKIFRADPLVTARMQRMMFYAFLLLIRSGLTLLEFEPLLTDRAMRTRLLIKFPLTDRLWQYWEKEFPQNDRLVTEWTQSSLNKVGEMTNDPDFELMLGQTKSTIDFRAIMDQSQVLLVKLPKGQLTERGSHLMGAFILGQIQLAALSRASRPYTKFPRFTLFIDEFQNYATDDIHEILAESRKYRLSLVMAHQFYGQLRDAPKLQDAVLNTVGNIICFQMGAHDAEQFVRDIFAPPVDEIKDIRRRRVPTGFDLWPYMIEEEPVWRPLPEIWELETRRLTQLNKREFWYKRRGPYPAQRLRTLEMPDIKRTPQLESVIAELVARSVRANGRDKARVRAEIDARKRALSNDDGGDKISGLEIIESD